MSPPVPLSVRVWGDLACFTRPELKAERVSYPLMTPSAARGVLEAIFWKPQFRWEVVSIEVLRPVSWITFRRNEVASIPALASVRTWSSSGGGYDVETDRDQRSTLALRDVAYVVKAQIVPASGSEGDGAGYRDQFRRRVDRGRCFSQPFLGCREFAAGFGPVDPSERPIDWDDHLGLMFYGFDYATTPPASHWFAARLEHGVMLVPAEPLAEDAPGSS